MRWMRRGTARHGERGSAAIEAVIGVSAFVMLGTMIIAGGRVAITQQAVEAAAAEAAREASIARDPGTAQAAARARGLASLDNQEVPCTARDVNVDTRGFSAPLGTAATVEAIVTCDVDLSDVALPGVPGELTITRTMSSPIDSYRER